MATPQLASPSERSAYIDFVLRHQPHVQRLLSALQLDATQVRLLLQRTFVRAHGLQPHVEAGEEPEVWLGRAALHLARPEAPAIVSNDPVHLCHVLVGVLQMPAERAASMLRMSASRAQRYAERTTTKPAAVNAPPLGAAEADALAEAVVKDLEAGPPSFELASSKLLRAPVVEDVERDSRRASLRNLSDLVAPPTTRRAPSRKDEDSGIVTLSSSSKWPVALPVDAAPLPAPVPAPVPPTAAPAAAPTAAASAPSELSSETPSATPAVVSLPEPAPTPAPATVRVRTETTAPSRRLVWLAPLAAAGVAAAIAVALTRPAPTNPVQDAPTVAPAAARPVAAPIAESAPTEPTSENGAWGEPAGLDPASLPVNEAAVVAPVDSAKTAKNVATAPPSAGKTATVAAEPARPPATPAAPAAAAPATKPAATDSLTAAMHGAVGVDPNAPAATTNDNAARAPADAPRRPPQGAVTSALGKVTGNAKRCIGPDDPISRATLVFASSGVVQSIAVTGHAAGKPAEACIKSALQAAKLPPFADPEYRATVTVRP